MTFLFTLIIAGCTAAEALPTATLVPTPTPSPTRTLTPVASSSPTTAFTPTPVSLPPGKEIVFDESGNTDFTGTAYGEGETAIILANMSIGGEMQWSPFVAALDKQDFTTITFSYRNINDVGPDMDLILGWLKENGFKRVICIGASLGTRACSSIAREPELVGMVLIAGSVHHASVAESTYPKLFISGALDVWAFDIQTGYEQAAEPKTLVLFENSRAHGTDLFHSKESEQFISLLIDFVNSLAGP